MKKSEVKSDGMVSKLNLHDKEIELKKTEFKQLEYESKIAVKAILGGLALAFISLIVQLF